MSHASQKYCSISWHRSRLLSNRLSRLTPEVFCKPVHVLL